MALHRRTTNFYYFRNNIHPTIKFTSSHSPISTSFLDVKVSLDQFGKVETDLCTKPTDKHQYLLQSSWHPLHTKRAIPFSLALRLRRICSSDVESFTLRANELIKYLNDRGYNLSFLKEEIQRVHAITHNETLKPSQTTTNRPCRVPLVFNANTILPFVPYQVSYKNTLKSFRLPHDAAASFKRHLLLLSDEPTTLVTFYLDLIYVLINKLTSPRDLSMRQKLRHLPLYHRRPYKLYLFCQWGNKNHSWSYWLQLDRCTPSTRPTRSSRPTAVSDHFLSDNHSTNDIPLELMYSSRDALRKAREAYLIERGQTLEPKGINKREEIESFITFYYLVIH